MVTLADRIALLLAIKEEGKRVDFDHIYDKVGRDVAFLNGAQVGRDEVQDALQSLVREGLAEQVKDEYAGTPPLDPHVRRLILEESSQLNRSYVIVWLAKTYYPHIASLMTPFLKGRPLSTVKVFSGKKDPINQLETIFVRYARYKPKPVPLTVEDEGRLLSLVYDHCVDFIPYVHRLDAKEPDLFILDLDAGSKLLQHPQSFEFIKHVTRELVELLEELEIPCLTKFSGSRGFQIWTSFDNAALREAGDVFRAYRELAVKLQSILEERLQGKSQDILSLFPGVCEPGEPMTTSKVAGKEERATQILVDWSSMKPMGDVRSPYSIHYKTGLASLPLDVTELQEFQPGDAHPLKVIERLERYRVQGPLEASDPSRLLAA